MPVIGQRRAVVRLLGLALSLALVSTGLAKDARSEEKVTVAALTFVSSSPLFIAYEKGYFAEAGLDVEFRFFRAAQPVAVAIASGDADFGVTAFTAGFFNLAGKGALKVVGAQLHERDGYDGSAILVSNQAHAAGFTSVDKFPGHSFAMTQVGSSFHYMIGRIAEAQGFALKDVSLKPLQAVPNMIGALKSGQVDAMIIVPHIAKPLAKGGAAKIIGWVRDYAPYQVGGLFTSTRNVEARPELVRAFAGAYQKGAADYHRAFLQRKADGTPADPAHTEAMVALIHGYVYKDQPAEKAHPRIRNGAMYIDAEARLDVADVREQVRWYQAKGLVDAGVEAESIIDTRFIPALPGSE